jgi:hypothetical protein
MATRIERIGNALVWGIESQLPQPCRATRQCQQAGGCPTCYAPMMQEHRARLLFAVEAHEEYSDRLADEQVFGTPRRKPQ